MLSPKEFIRCYADIGAAKTRTGATRLLLLAVLAGFFIAIAGSATNVAAHSLSSVSAAKTVCGALFPFGIIMVVLTGAELFTGNCLITVSVLDGTARLSGLLRNLAIVYLGNFIGAALTAAACVYSGQLDMSGGALAVYTVRIAAAKCSLGFGKALLLGVLCNILVCVSVYCALCAKSVPGRAVGAHLPVCIFVICGFEHSIANMYYIPAGLLALRVPRYAQLVSEAGVELSRLTAGSFLLNNLLPVTLGNILGGLGFAALMWYCFGGKDRT